MVSDHDSVSFWSRLVLCSRLKHVSHKLYSESNKHKVNIGPVRVLITCDQCWCLLLKCKVSAGQREWGGNRLQQRRRMTGPLMCIWSWSSGVIIIQWSPRQRHDASKERESSTALDLSSVQDTALLQPRLHSFNIVTPEDRLLEKCSLCGFHLQHNYFNFCCEILFLSYNFNFCSAHCSLPDKRMSLYGEIEAWHYAN